MDWTAPNFWSGHSEWLMLHCVMAFKDLVTQSHARLLQRSLERGRLGHAYLLEGESLSDLETVARTLAKTLNCEQPVRGDSGQPIDCCDECASCRNTDHDTHVDIHWVRPASKTRVITAEQTRDLLGEIHLKPTAGGYKIAIIAGADRMNTQAANIFLKTLEEPPQRSVLLLLTTEPQRLLETIQSRCLRLRFWGDQTVKMPEEDRQWLNDFSALALEEESSLIGRYRLLGLLLARLAEKKSALEKELEAQSPLNRHTEVEKSLRDQWESELAAAIESEYRRQRTDLLRNVQHWLRDIWICGLGSDASLLSFPTLGSTAAVAQRISSREALQNLDVIEKTQRLLHTNVQEALALEVGLLKLRL